MKRFLFLAALLFWTLLANAQLSVTVSAPRISGQKAIVPLALKNGFAEKVDSARAAVFLFDEQGKMLGQATRWVIGGSKVVPGLAPGTTNVFNFVITVDKPFPTTNLTAKVSFSRVVLEGGKLADAGKEVVIQRGGQ